MKVKTIKYFANFTSNLPASYLHFNIMFLYMELTNLNLNSKQSIELPHNESEIIPLIDSIKDLVTEMRDSDDD